MNESQHQREKFSSRLVQMKLFNFRSNVAFAFFMIEMAGRYQIQV